LITIKKLNKDEEDSSSGHIFGSAINPGNISGKKKEDEIAKPNVKVEVKTFNRDVTKGGAT